MTKCYKNLLISLNSIHLILVPLRKDIFLKYMERRNNSSIYSLTVQFSRSVVSDSLWPHGPQHARPPCPSPTPAACSNSCPSTQLWIQLSHPLSSPSPPALDLSQHQGLFQWVSSSHQVAKVLEFQPQHQSLTMNIQDWFPLEFTGWISLQSRGLSRVFSNTTVQKHWFFGIQLSLQFNSHIHTWLLEKP